MRKITSLFVFILSLVFAMGTLFACGGNDGEENNQPVTYTATVLDEGGSGISGAIVRFKVGGSVKEKTTNIAGVASLEVAAADLSLQISAEVVEVPDGYGLPSGAVQYGAGQTSVTFTAGSVVKYTVNVLSGNSAVEGARIRLFVGGSEVDTLFTNMYGKAEFSIYSTSETVSAKILSVPQGYALPEVDTLTFGADKVLTFAAAERVSYTVKTQDIYHKAVLGVTVSVYTLDEKLIATKTVSSQNGVVFTLDKNEYYLVVEVINPSIICMQGEVVNGLHRVKIDAGRTSSHMLEFVQTEENIEYSVILKDSEGNLKSGIAVNLYSSVHELLSTAISDSDGVASFSVPNGSYIAFAMPTDMNTSAEPVYFEKDGAVVGEISIRGERAGVSAGNAAMLFDNGHNVIYIPGGESSWYYVPNGINRTVVIEDADGVTLIYDGNEYTAISGVITVVLETSGEALIEIVNDTLTDKKLSLSVNKKGTANNPISLPLGENIEILLANGELVYYTFTANGDKTLSFSFSGSYSDLAAVYYNGKIVEKLVLKNGETVVLALGAHNYEGGSVSYSARASFEQKFTDYTVSVHKENSDILSGIMVQLYRDGVAMPGMLKATDAEGVVVFENIPEYSGYTAKIVNISEGYEVLNNDVAFTDNLAGVAITLIPNGTLESPYDILIGQSDKYNSIIGGVVWFEINIRGMSEHLLEIVAQGSRIDIYDEKGGAVLLTLYAADGKIVYVFNDSSVSDALDEGVYYIKLTLPGEAASVSVALAGDIPTLPHKIGEAGEYVATVKENGGVVYYSFTGALDAASRVTVSVESAASLTVGGVLIAGGEYTFICDGAEILFEISADVAENYNFTITVE